MKRIFVLALLCALLTIQVSAAGVMDFVYEEGGRTKTPIPLTHTTTGFWDYFGSDCGYLREPSDLFIASDDTVYIADTGNNRIVHLSAEGKFLASYNDGGKLKNPKGVFVEDDGDIYIGDTGNERIVHLSPAGEYIEEFTKPESNLLDEEMSFQISRVSLSRQGYLYTIRGQYFMTIDADNEFKGFIGTNRVGFSLKRVLIRMFASREQQAKILNETPASYNSFDIGPDGLVYAVTDGTASSGQIQVINMVGQNIYPGGAYGTRYYNEHTGKYNQPLFTDIAVSGDKNIYVLEQYSRHIFIYDPEGQLLAVLGGEGEVKGLFATPAAIDLNSSGDIFVLDQKTGYVHRLTPTDFFNEVITAVNEYTTGEYEQAYETWQKVLKINPNYSVANRGVARSLYKFGDNKQALEYFELADDKAGYGEAFSDYRYALFQKHFGWIIFAAAAILAGTVFLVTFLKKRADRFVARCAAEGPGLRAPLQMKALLAVFHPLDFLDLLKTEDKGKKPWAAAVFCALTAAGNYACIFYTHYSLGSKSTEDASLLLEAALVTVPLISWTLCAFAISAISDGECHLSRLMNASAYSLVPYIALAPVLGMLSRVLSYSEVAIYNSLRGILLIWVLILLFTALKRLNDYTFSKTVRVAVVSLVLMVIMWAVALLLFSLTVQSTSFITGIFQEFGMKHSG